MDRRTMLESWLEVEPGDPQERAHVEAMRRLLGGAGDPFSRDHLSPGHVTASAFVLAPTGGELAMIFHDALERWLQPGGHVEPGDADLVEAARREVREELGLERLTLLGDGPVDFDVHPIPARGSVAGHRHFDVRFLFRAGSRELRIGDGVRAVDWVAPARLAAIGDASMRRVLSKL